MLRAYPAIDVLLERLPAGCWPDRDESASWSVEAHLLAGLIDALQWNTWATVAPHSKSKPAKPKPVRRPGDRKRRPAARNGQRSTSSELAALFGNMRRS
jgi:hypothetical protein